MPRIKNVIRVWEVKIELTSVQCMLYEIGATLIWNNHTSLSCLKGPENHSMIYPCPTLRLSN